MMNDFNIRCDNKIAQQDQQGFFCCMPHCQEEVARRNNKKSKKFSKSDQDKKFQAEEKG